MENVLIFQEMLDFSTPGSFKRPKRTFLYVLCSTLQKRKNQLVVYHLYYNITYHNYY